MFQKQKGDLVESIKYFKRKSSKGGFLFEISEKLRFPQIFCRKLSYSSCSSAAFSLLFPILFLPFSSLSTGKLTFCYFKQKKKRRRNFFFFLFRWRVFNYAVGFISRFFSPGKMRIKVLYTGCSVIPRRGN